MSAHPGRASRWAGAAIASLVLTHLAVAAQAQRDDARAPSTAAHPVQLAQAANATAGASAAGRWRAQVSPTDALWLTLHPDGSAEVLGLVGKWEQQGDRVQLTSPDGAAMGELTDGRLLVVVGGMPMVFVRVGGAPVDVAPVREAPRFKASRGLAGKTVAPEGAFASVRVPRGWGHRMEGDVLIVADRRGAKSGEVRVMRRALSGPNSKRPLDQLLREAVERETEGAPTETVLPPEAVRVGPYDGARAELKAHVITADGAFTKIDVDVFVLRADRFVYVFAGVWPPERRGPLRPVLETLVSTFRFRKPTENKRLKRGLQGCWTRVRGSATPADGWSGASEAQYRFDGPSSRFAYDATTLVSGPGASASSETHEQGTFVVVGRALTLLPDDGASRDLVVMLRGRQLELGGMRFVPCD